LTESEVIEKANIFLATQGYSTEDLIVDAELTRQATLLADLQNDLGRRNAFEIIRSDDGDFLPVYYWRIRYDILDPDSSDDDLLPSSSTVFTVHMNQDGVVWSFLNTTSRIGPSAGLLGSARNSVNRIALANAIRPADSTLRQTLDALRTVPDSLLLANLRFDRSSSATPSTEANQTGDDSVREGDNSVFLQMILGRYVRLKEDVLESLAQYHAPDLLPDSARWRVDSVQVLPARNDQLARVRLTSTSTIHLQEVRADVTVSAVGSVQSLAVSYNPDRVRSTDVEQLIGIILVTIYIILGLVLVIVFFRRVMARLVDIKSALLDGIIIGSLFAMFIVLSRQNFDFGHAPVWVSVGLRLLVFSGVAGAMTLLTFMFSAVSESLSRDVWPKKSLTLSLLRRGELRNTVVGSSLLRGVALAAILLGLSMLFLILFQDVSLRTEANLLTGSSRRPLVYAAAGSASRVYLILLIILLGLGTFIRRLGGHSLLVVLVITLFGGLLQLAPIGVELGWNSFGLSAAIALVISLFFVRYDFLTAYTGLAVAQFVWALSEGFLVSGSPAWIDSYLGGAGVMGVIGIGLVGTFSKRSGRDLREFVPEYIVEMTGQERIKRELEIAHQVQASFLPRTMPDIVGLDLAGMCLPANEVGGDYFDFIELSDRRLAFVVGDVSGKGTQAAFYMTLVKGMIQTLSGLDYSPDEVMCRLNGLFRKKCSRRNVHLTHLWRR